MSENQNYHSEWRIEFTRELSQIYSANEHVKMIVLGGSPSRGLSDEYSDIDMVVYWDTIDKDFISRVPLQSSGGELKLQIRDQLGTVQMELYYFDTLIFEVGHMTLTEWEQLTDNVLINHAVDPYMIKSIDGFLEAVPIYGVDIYQEQHKKLESYPHELAVKIVSKNLGFFWRGCILNQGIKRNEIVFYHDAFCMTVKRLVAILAALNHRYLAPIEPRWIEQELELMQIKPDQTWQRIESVFMLDPEQGNAVLDTLIAEVVALVREHMPEADMTRFNENNALEVRATLQKPKLTR